MGRWRSKRAHADTRPVWLTTRNSIRGGDGKTYHLLRVLDVTIQLAVLLLLSDLLLAQAASACAHGVCGVCVRSRNVIYSQLFATLAEQFGDYLIGNTKHFSLNTIYRIEIEVN